MTVFTVLSTLAGVSVRGVERFGASKRRARLSIIRKNRTGELGAGAATSSKRNHRSRILYFSCVLRLPYLLRFHALRQRPPFIENIHALSDAVVDPICV